VRQAEGSGEYDRKAMPDATIDPYDTSGRRLVFISFLNAREEAPQMWTASHPLHETLLY